jgi:hypothetical protein
MRGHQLNGVSGSGRADQTQLTGLSWDSVITDACSGICPPSHSLVDGLRHQVLAGVPRGSGLNVLFGREDGGQVGSMCFGGRARISMQGSRAR